MDCIPGLGGVAPLEPLVTYASPIEDEPTAGGFGGTGGSVPIVGALGVGGGGGGTTPVTPAVPDVPAGPVPEPSVWLMMITGVGTLGAALRRRRNRAREPFGGRSRGAAGKATLGGALWSGSAAVEAGDLAATVAVKSAIASAAGKAMLCVCPAVVVAGSVMAVPPLRQAVHASTSIPETAPTVAATIPQAPLPCEEAVTVPIAASSWNGFQPLVDVAAASTPVATAASTPVVAAGG